jgi:hypothetical protein
LCEIYLGARCEISLYPLPFSLFPTSLRLLHLVQDVSILFNPRF